jgi:hypothetical protein
MGHDLGVDRLEITMAPAGQAQEGPNRPRAAIGVKYSTLSASADCTSLSVSSPPKNVWST